MPRQSLAFIAACSLLIVPLIARADGDGGAIRTTSAAYGEDMLLQSVDVYAPVPSRGEPLIVFVHGGGWMQGDKSQYAPLGRAFARCGVAFAALNYRLAPQVTVSQQAADIAEAVRWLVDSADGQGYASDRIFLMGHSAGAELAAFTATSPSILGSAHLSKQNIAGVIAVDGTAYNPTLDALEAGRLADLQLDEFVFGTDVALWKRYDIGRNLAGDEPPFLVVHGQHDSIVPAAQPRLLVDELRAAGDRVAYLQPDRDHMTVLENMMVLPDDPLRVAITRFVSTGSLQSL